MDNVTLCSGIRDELALYHYGELGPADEGRVREHLLVCADCRAELAEIERALAAVPAWDVSRAEAAAAARGVMERLSPVRRSPLRGYLPVFAAVAAVLLVVAVGVFRNPDTVKAPPSAERTVTASAGRAVEPGKAPSGPADGDTVQGRTLDKELPAVPQSDYEVIENLELLANLELLEELDTLEGIEDL